MKSLILTCLYLFKDTLHRWKERPASPLSRILVAFFLSLCALSFLANYVLSAKMLHDEIRKNGADLIIVFDTVRDGEPSKKNLLQHELPSLYGCDVLVLNDARAGVARVGKTVFPILEYNMESCSFLSALGLEDVATVLLYNPPIMLASAMPMSRKRSGYALAKLLVIVALERSASSTTSSGYFSASSTSISP